MNEREIRLKALNVSESALKTIEDKIYPKAVSRAMATIKTNFPTYGIATPEEQSEMLQKVIDRDLKYREDWIFELTTLYNQTLLEKIERIETAKESFNEMVDSYDEKLKEKDRIIQNLLRK